MTATVPTVEPASIVAGDRIQWKKTLSDYPAGTWTLVYYFLNASGKFSITAGTDGTDHSVDVAAATSKAYAAGKYDGQGRVTSGTDIYVVWRGRIEVLANFELAGSRDERTHARKMLEAIEAELEGRATAAQTSMLEYTIGSRNYRRDPKILLEWRDRYSVEVAAEDVAAAIANGTNPNRRFMARL